MAADDVLQGCRREEIFLSQTQLLAGWRRVAWIEYARDRLGLRARRGGADDVAGVEGREVDRHGGARAPQAQRIDVTATPASDRRIVCDSQHALGRIPDAARGF